MNLSSDSEPGPKVYPEDTPKPVYLYILIYYAVLCILGNLVIKMLSLAIILFHFINCA